MHFITINVNRSAFTVYIHTTYMLFVECTHVFVHLVLQIKYSSLKFHSLELMKFLYVLCTPIRRNFVNTIVNALNKVG